MVVTRGLSLTLERMVRPDWDYSGPWDRKRSTPQLPWLTLSLVYTGSSSKVEPWAASDCALQVTLSWRRNVFSSGGPWDTQMKMLLCPPAQATLSPWEWGQKNARARYRLFFGSWACFFHPGSISLRRIWALAFHGEVFLFLVFRACLSYHLLGHFFFLGATSRIVDSSLHAVVTIFLYQ